MPISIFDTRVKLRALEELFPARTFFRDTFFTNTQLADGLHVDVDVYKGKRRTAAYVNPLAEGQIISRNGYTTSTYDPPYLKPKRPTTAKDLMTRLPGEIIYQGDMTAEDRAREILMKDLTELDDYITRAEELQATQGMINGAVTITDGNQINFGMSASHLITLTGNDLWSNVSGSPISHPLILLDGWRKLIMKDCGLTPDILIMGSNSLEAFINHPDVKGSGGLTPIKITLGQIEPKLLPDGVIYWGYMNSLGCDVYTYDEWYRDENDVEQPMVPLNQVIMASTRARFNRCYGAIQDLNAMFAVARFPKSWITDDPSVRWVQMQSAPLLVPVQIDAIVSATVL